MDNKPLKKHRRFRTWIQAAVTAVMNGNLRGFLDGDIYRGASKTLCVPGLNCYSCPGALGSCPIGSLQATLASGRYRIAFYVTGFLVAVGAFFGRLICGWACPFGLVQDLLNKIPFRGKRKNLPGERVLKKLKYVILALFVVILPLTVLDIVGQGKPWFCKYICPSGTLFAGIPMTALNPELGSAIGWLFWLKVGILIGLVVLSVVVYRPFCRYLCPLGAVYGFFNPIAAYRLKVDPEKCTSCGACQTACRLDIPAYKTPNSMECIRCGDCRHACPHGAIKSTFILERKDK